MGPPEERLCERVIEHNVIEARKGECGHELQRSREGEGLGEPHEHVLSIVNQYFNRVNGPGDSPVGVGDTSFPKAHSGYSPGMACEKA